VTFVEAILGTFFAAQRRNNAQQGRSDPAFFLVGPILEQSFFTL